MASTGPTVVGGAGDGQLHQVGLRATHPHQGRRRHELGLDGRETFAERRAPDVVGPHDQRVLAVVAVVRLAGAGGREAEPAVQRLGPEVGDPDLQGQLVGTEGEGLVDLLQEEPGGDGPTLPGWLDRHRGHVAVVGDHQQTRIARDHGTDPGHQVGPTGPGQLVLEQPDRPRTRVHLLFDGHHGPQVAAPHG